MPRKKRDWYPGATYHVMCRGIRRMAIFREEEDYEMFLLMVKKTMECLLNSVELTASSLYLTTCRSFVGYLEGFLIFLPLNSSRYALWMIRSMQASA